MKFCKIILVIISSLLVLGLLVGCGKSKKDPAVTLNSSEGLEFASNNDGTCLVSGIGTCQNKDIVIPAKSPSGEKVIGLGIGAFSNCSDIKSVTLPKGSTMISDSAFWMCASLESVVIPEGVKTIGGSAFSSCISLKKITLPSSVQSIGGQAFSNCIALEEVNIPEGVTAIEHRTFEFCPNLLSITIPSSVNRIESYAFDRCTSLVEIYNKSSLKITTEGYSYDSPEGPQMTYLGKYALRILTDKSESYLKRIDDYVFYDDGNEVKLVKYLGKERDTTIPSRNGLFDYEIHDYAFAQNTYVVSVKIPEGITKIGEGAFESCSSLTYIVAPSSLSYVSNTAFLNCVSLVEICNKSALFFCDFANHIPDESYSGINIVGDYVFYEHENDIYLVKYSGNEKNLVLPEYQDGKIYKVKSFAFINPFLGTNVPTIKSITIPDFVTEIQSSSFYGYSSLETVVIGDGIKSADGAFFLCRSIKSVRFGKSFAEFDSFPLYTNVLTSIIVDEDNPYYKSIDGNLYSKDGKVIVQYAVGKTDSSFVIPDGVTTIGKNAFNGCKSLTSVVMPEGLTTIEYRAFYICNNFDKVVIPRSVQTVGEDAFTLPGPNGFKKVVYYTGTEEEWKALRKNNSNHQTGLPSVANYNYVPEE